MITGNIFHLFLMPKEVNSAVCTRSQDRKGRDNCVKCGRNLCAEHRHAICIFCIQSN
nr:unnamed protein product [Callosobruchus chinensis]